MGKFTHDDVLDAAINEIKNNATRIDTIGDWLAQAYYEKGTYEGHTIPVTVFTVVANLDGT
ncbi:MAG: hypothetical protein J0M11_01480 [Anaerolineae bacterium]|nr:hypothetical protein [Anaerolineae bacterium]